MKNFEDGDLVQVVGWDSPAWEKHTYEVQHSYVKFNSTYYRLVLVGEDKEQSKIYPVSREGSFTAKYLRYAGPRHGTEVDLLKLSVPELASLVRQATDRIIELTKDA